MDVLLLHRNWRNWLYLTSDTLHHPHTAHVRVLFFCSWYLGSAPIGNAIQNWISKLLWIWFNSYVVIANHSFAALLLLISISTGIDRQPFAIAMRSHENCVVNFEREMATISIKEDRIIIGSGYSGNSLLLSFLREDLYTFWAIWGGNMRLPKRNASVFSQKSMFTLRLNIHRYPPPLASY